MRKMIDQGVEIAKLYAERKRLRNLVRISYMEGYKTGDIDNDYLNMSEPEWIKSRSKRSLER